MNWVLSKEEQQIFLDTAKSHHYYFVFELALSTGMRSGELRGLEWKDIDFQNKIIHVRGTLVQNRYGFYKDTGHPLEKGYLNNAIDTLTVRIQKTMPDFKELSIHTMRHSFTTHCIENGMEPVKPL